MASSQKKFGEIPQVVSASVRAASRITADKLMREYLNNPIVHVHLEAANRGEVHIEDAMIECVRHLVAANDGLIRRITHTISPMTIKFDKAKYEAMESAIERGEIQAGPIMTLPADMTFHRGNCDLLGDVPGQDEVKPTVILCKPRELDDAKRISDLPQ